MAAGNIESHTIRNPLTRSVILFRPAYDPLSNSVPVYPWALVCLASELVRRGIKAHIIDEAGEGDCSQRIRRLLEAERPVAFGVTSMTGDQIRFGLQASRLVRECSPATAIVWGGIHASLLPEQTAAHELVDCSVAGEGEYVFSELVECLLAGQQPDLPGVFCKRDGAIAGRKNAGVLDFASLPELPYELADVERYVCRRSDLGVNRYFEVATSRGCPHHCGFCYIESVHGSRWRALDANQAVERICEVVRRFNLDCVSFREDNFFVNRGRVEGIARGIIEAKLNIKWAASCRINYFAKYDDKFIELLKRSGCALLTFGVESGSDRVLEFIRKDISVDMVMETARKVREAGIRGTYHFMGGFPGETEQEFLDTCRLIERLRAFDVTVREMSIFAPYPGVGLIPECVRRGYREPQSLEEWIKMDWSNPRRPWLTERQSRLIADAQFLIARLNHRNAAVRAWANARWRRMLASKSGITLPERPVLESLRRLRR
jgi:radical SAM superfamily enzyme YgiQ (UPF0313 family)